MPVVFIFLTIVLILVSSYVGASKLSQENKQGYFVVVGILILAIVIFNVIFGQ